MKDNFSIGLLCSLPIILILLYFIPFLGVCLIIFRFIIYYNDKRRISLPYYLVSTGLIILIPKILRFIFEKFEYSANNIPYFNKIVDSELYRVDFVSYAKLLITVGIVFLIISSIVSVVVDKVKTSVTNAAKSYISNQEKRNDEISRKNDLIMKEKREIAKNTQVVICPYCGADNMFTSKSGTCKYCRRKIEGK